MGYVNKLTLVAVYSIKRESFNGGILKDEQRESTCGYLHHKGKSYS